MNDDDWTCPQVGCDRPLSAHLVTLADRAASQRRPDPLPPKTTRKKKP